MIFTETKLPGAMIIAPEPKGDDRGFLMRTYCRGEFEARGLDADIAQCSISFNREEGTLRGLHYQEQPHDEVKLVRCIAGAIWDVIVDLRPHSPAFKQWVSVELSAENHTSLYIPKGMAHGFITLSDGVEILYQISQPYCPESARGVRWNDPAFAIEWPGEVRSICDRDRDYPDFES